jgi:hypothetical protein
MPNYNRQHAYYAGVDLHARTLFLHICDPAGQALDSPVARPDRAVTLRGSSALIEWTDRRNGEVSGARLIACRSRLSSMGIRPDPEVLFGPAAVRPRSVDHRKNHPGADVE